MNVLFLSQRVPFPPDRGDRITTYHFLRHLAARGAHLRVGCLAEEDADTAAATAVGEWVDAVCAPRIHRDRRRVTSVRGLLTGEPLTLPFFRHGELRRTVDRWVAEDPPDVIYVYSSSMAQYAMPHGQALRLMQFAELDSDKWRQYSAAGGRMARAIYSREAKRLLEFERSVARAFDVSFVVSETERELFRQQIPDVDPIVLPNGVDVDHFCSAGDAHRQAHRLVFTGVMDYQPNVDGVIWFVNKCWPAVRRAFTDATFSIVGSKPSAAVLALAGEPGVEVTGRVPETPPYFDQAAVAIAPLRLARGVQNKVLEAMSMALPVVTSPQAAQGLGQVPAGTMTVADGVTDTVDGVCALLADPAAARTMGQRAAQWVRQHFRWQNMFDRLDAVIDERL